MSKIARVIDGAGLGIVMMAIIIVMGLCIGSAIFAILFVISLLMASPGILLFTIPFIIAAIIGGIAGYKGAI